jgi:hypothetical protein
MRSFITVLMILLLIFVVSCAAIKQEEIDPWLTTISGAKPAEIDITGKWRDTAGTGMMTWGEGYLYQEQNKVRGVMGDYSIKGIVSGKIVYLVFMIRDGNKVSYTARLENLKDLLIGYYFRATDKEQKKGYETSFVRVVDIPTK